VTTAVARRRGALLALVLLAACHRTTGTLGDEQLKRFESEGIVRRAVDLVFRQTHDVGTRDSGWEELTASIVVTKQSVVIHRGDTFRLEITPRSIRFSEVSRDHDRLSLHVGGGKSAVSWSFRPPDDAEGWAEDIRAVINETAGAKRRAGQKPS
jgi:hypothetical protein